MRQTTVAARCKWCGWWGKTKDRVVLHLASCVPHAMKRKSIAPSKSRDSPAENDPSPIQAEPDEKKGEDLNCVQCMDPYLKVRHTCAKGEEYGIVKIEDTNCRQCLQPLLKIRHTCAKAKNEYCIFNTSRKRMKTAGEADVKIKSSYETPGMPIVLVTGGVRLKPGLKRASLPSLLSQRWHIPNPDPDFYLKAQLVCLCSLRLSLRPWWEARLSKMRLSDEASVTIISAHHREPKS